MEALAPWATPAIVVALFLWLRADIRTLRQDLSARMDSLEKRMDGLEERLRMLEIGLAELRGEMRFIRDYITGRNARNELSDTTQGDD